ncbi:hypothetical protein TSUD_112650 [Trifolium subterraneum]|uniref:Auxin-induced protein n=1 Tax=Trifolium subterraneum TaxID=3900 RepID=A0A2Z6LTV9_TRISU|nr:hypothetical protein TSUD_112650 [Trifolium subterraneum]
MDKTSSSLNFKETELRLGLPGCESPDRKPVTSTDRGVSFFGNKNLNINVCSPLNNLVASVGAKRGFSNAIDESVKKLHEKNKQVAGTNEDANAHAPAAKTQIVGWPPIRSFRKNTMASNLTKSNDEAEGKPGFECLYVKVSMDGAPYLRKVDLKIYNNYMELSSALEKMMFADSCRRLRIMKGSEAIGLAPRAMEKS